VIDRTDPPTARATSPTTSTVSSARQPDATFALWLALGATIVSGVLYGVAFPPLAWRPLAWIALVPWLIAIRRSSLKRTVLLGVLWAHVETYVTSDCLPGAVVSYYRQSPAIGWLMLEGATLVTMVPWYTAFAVAYRALAQRYTRSLPLLAAAAWVAVELARATALGGNPWAISGYTQVGFLPLMQIADLFGVHGISFLIATGNAALADLWLARHETSTRLAALRGVAASIALVLLAVSYGGASLWRASAEDLGPPTPVAIVQGNLDLGSQWRSEMYGRNLDAYLRLTWDAGKKSAPRIVFWPESALTFFLADEPSYRAAIGRVLTPLGSQLITGGPRSEPAGDGEPAYFNATFLVSPSGDVLAWQDKTKLLPFAEYFPLPSLDLLRRKFGRARQFSVGDAHPPMSSVAGRVGVVVCNESMFPEPAADRVANGADLLVNPANDSWFGSLKYSLQAFDMARLRAVEQRRYLVRTSTAGPSAIIDPWGRVESASTPFAKEWIQGTVRTSSATTVYHRLGDLFAIACAAVALAGLCVGWWNGHGLDRSGPRESGP
jgi:apolipoprotein N-acyltransferase